MLILKGNEFTEIKPIKPTTIFQPFGKVVNQYTYANIRIHINITSLFDEVEQLCYASKLLKKGKKEMNTSGSSRKLVHMLTEDLVHACNQSTRKLKALTKTFGFKRVKIPDYASAFYKGNITKNREKRQLIIGGIIAITSILSIYSVSQLINIATSNDDELVTQTNHIINAIEDHENRIVRNDEDIKRLMQHIEKLEEEILISQDLQMIVARIFSIKTQALSIQSHLEGIEVGLYNLLKGQLTPYLVSVDTIQKGLNKLRSNIVNKGFLLATYDANEALQLQSSFVSLTNGTILALLHIPVFRAMSTLYIYKYIPIPIASNDNGTTIIIEPEQSYLAVSLKEEYYIEIQEDELEHKCTYIKDTFFCNGAILKKGYHNSCLHALYKNELSKIGDTCPIKLYNGEEYVKQLNSSTFIVYGKEPTRIYVICTNHDGQKVYENSMKLTGTNYLQIYKACDISLKNHILSHNLPFSIDLDAKMIEAELHIQELLSLGEREMADFLDFIKNDLETQKVTMHITSAKEKFDLKLIKGHSSLLSKIFSTSISVIAIIIGIMITIAVARVVMKQTRQKQLDRQPRLKINLQSLLANIDTETESDAQNTTKKESKEGEYVTLRG